MKHLQLHISSGIPVDSEVIPTPSLSLVKRHTHSRDDLDEHDAGFATEPNAATSADRTENTTMAPNVYLDALNKAMNAELIEWSGPDSSGSSRRRGRTIAALLFGASTVVGTTTEEIPAVSHTAPATTTALGSAPVVPAHFRPAIDRADTINRVLANAKHRVQNDSQPAQAVATLALELGRLQRDLATRSPEGMEEWIAGEYASLEAVRRAIADVVVDEAEPALVAVALDRASELLTAAS